jgi:glycine betaine/choline ABC-type transport system substrate-binding protein
MNISKFKLALKYLFGGIDSVMEYLLEIVNEALAKIDPANRAKIAAAYNTISRVASTLLALKWLCPTKWQSAYEMTIIAASDTASALEDFKIEPAELTKVKDAFNAAVTAWRGGDVPDTDVDFDGVGIED